MDTCGHLKMVATSCRSHAGKPACQEYCRFVQKMWSRHRCADQLEARARLRQLRDVIMYVMLQDPT